MPDADAPQAEPLTLTLEEARRRHDAAREELGRLCHGGRFRMSIPAQPDDSDVILGDALQALKALTEGHDLVPRDDTAALVAAVESGLHYIKWAEEHGHMGAPSSRTLIEAALARVRSELGEGWDEPYAHRDPGNARPARTARKAKGER